MLKKGKYVKKGNLNSLHNGVVLDHPEKPQKGFVYQTLINTEVNDNLKLDNVDDFYKAINYGEWNNDNSDKLVNYDNSDGYDSFG